MFQRRAAVYLHPAHDDATLDRMGREAVEMTEGRGTEVLMAREKMVLDVGGA